MTLEAYSVPFPNCVALVTKGADGQCTTDVKRKTKMLTILALTHPD